MSSTESSGASAEGTATAQQADANAAALSFGTSRGSGLARGKRPSSTHAPAASGAPVEYTPTAIEVINAPREYKNPFAPATTGPVVSADPPAAVVPESAPVAPPPVAPDPAPEPVARAHVSPAAAGEMFPLDDTPAPAVADERAELNILPPEQQKTVPHQTWESDGFRPAPAPAREREPRSDRPRRDERREGERRDEQPVPSKFRYERAKDGPLPPRPAPVSTATAPTPHKSGGFFGWLKSLFAGTPAEKPAEARNGEVRPEGREGHHHQRHRGGRDRGNYRGQGGGQSQPGGESRAEGNRYGERRDGGFRRRRRGGRGRGGYGGERSGGGPGGPPAT